MSKDAEKNTQTFSKGEGTTIDLGEDLLSEVKSNIPHHSSLQTGSVSEQIRNAEILISEGLLTGAKKILRSLLMTTQKQLEGRHQERIRHLLETIFQEEVKIILSEAPVPNNFESENIDKNTGEKFEFESESSRILEEKLDFQVQDEVAKQISEVINTEYLAENFWDGVAVYLQAGLFDSAKIILGRISTENGNFYSARLLLAEMELLKGDLVLSEKYVEEVLRDDQISDHLRTYGWYLKGRIAEALQKPKDAASWYALLGERGFRDSPERTVNLAAILKEKRKC